jgi:hypothetical protein
MEKQFKAIEILKIKRKAEFIIENINYKYFFVVIFATFFERTF